MISILMAVKTGSEYMQQSLGCVMAQTYTDWQLLIGVNGLGPDSVAYRKASNITHQARANGFAVGAYDLFTCGNKSQALNRMAAMAHGSHVAILDVDDLWHPLKLERQVRHLESCPDRIDVLGTQAEYFGAARGKIPLPEVREVTLDLLKHGNCLVNSSCLIRMDHALWDPDLEESCGVDDYPKWIRMAKAGCRLHNMPETLTYIRCHDGRWYDGRVKLDAIRSLC